MRQKIKGEADLIGRSMNAEIIARLERSFADESEDEHEREDLWRELHKRDAKIRQVQEEAFTNEQQLKRCSRSIKVSRRNRTPF